MAACRICRKLFVLAGGRHHRAGLCGAGRSCLQSEPHHCRQTRSSKPSGRCLHVFLFAGQRSRRPHCNATVCLLGMAGRLPCRCLGQRVCFSYLVRIPLIMKYPHLLLAILVTAIWGVNFSVIKLGLHTIDPFTLAAIRFTLSALPALFFIKKPDVPWRYLIGYGLIFGIGLWGLVNLGIKTGLSAGIASLALQFSAFFTLLLGSLIFRERLSRYQITGFVIACAGLLSIVFVTDGSVTLSGMLLVMAGALAWSVANIIIKKAGTKQVFAFLVWSSAFSPLPLFGLDWLVNGSSGFTEMFSHMDNRALLSVLFQVYPNTLFGYWIWNSLLKQYPVSTVAPLSLLVPVFGILGSMMIFGEHLSPQKMLALLLIIIGLTVGLYGQRLVQRVQLLPRKR
ncbi:probable amino acid metabolite efflux pump EamA [Pantoea ananatis AJ13355]|uniref:Probable amino acid metabolite efflux pump EamA n=2 Tax=Pantoea ananas TaxID=553 RepID=A0A0H3KZH8_PANAA|nr:probable amino acid metabolite efflux pump EamA [Pantoea ananatis AJ13355]